MQATTYTPQPTAAAIDSALANAMTGDRHEDVEPMNGRSSSIDEFVGRAGSFERGFVFTAGIIVGGLLLTRLFVGSAPMLGLLVPLLVLVALYAPRLKRGLNTTNEKINTRPRALAAGVLFPPYLFRVATDAFSRTEKAAILTSWVATLIGTLAVVLA